MYRYNMQMMGWLWAGLLALGCSGNDASKNGNGEVKAPPDTDEGHATDVSTGEKPVQPPQLIGALGDSWHEAWLGSPAVADIDGDGEMEIIAPRGDLVLGWHVDGQVVFRGETNAGRIWASPIVADLVPALPGLEIAAAARDKLFAWGADGAVLPGFPVSFADELRSIAAGDLDGDGALELVVLTTRPISQGGQRDIIQAFRMDGTPVPGYPPNTSGTAGGDDRCYVTGGFDQNLAVGDIDGDGTADIFGAQDNAYLSLHRGSGEAFDANPEFSHPTKFHGIRFLHDYDLARQGWANDEATALQAHFTNSAPAIADVDGDGEMDLLIVGSVQNAAQSERERGVALWRLRSDGSRPPGWEVPYHVPEYLGGLWDFDNTNVVALTNQVAVADIDADRPGLEMVFAGFDGRIHCVDAAGNPVWWYRYSDSSRVLPGGVVIADLSADGIPEIALTTYSPDADRSALIILDAAGREQHAVPLPGRGAMPVLTIADVDGNGTADIVVSLKDADDDNHQILIFEVPGSDTRHMPWPTGRGNLLRNGYVPIP